MWNAYPHYELEIQHNYYFSHRPYTLIFKFFSSSSTDLGYFETHEEALQVATILKFVVNGPGPHLK